MKIIIDNPDKIKDDEVSMKETIIKIVLVNNNKEIIMDNNHNTYYFINGYLKHNESINEAIKRILNNRFGLNIKNDYDPFLAYKKYNLDYPLFNDKSLYITYFFLIKADIIENENIALIPINNIIEILNDNMYDNPRNRHETMQNIEAIQSLLKEEK